MLGGQANPVAPSTPSMLCQAPFPKKPLGALRGGMPSNPELNRSLAEPAVTGGTTGVGVGAGAGGATVTGGTTGVGAGVPQGEGAVAGGVVTVAVAAGRLAVPPPADVPPPPDVPPPADVPPPVVPPLNVPPLAGAVPADVGLAL